MEKYWINKIIINKVFEYKKIYKMNLGFSVGLIVVFFIICCCVL